MAKKKKRYTDCINNIEVVRDFVRESFVFGLKDKNAHDEIGPRSYDEKTRQMKDWFRECMQIRTVKIRNKVKYITLDCREYTYNPLYKVWKACSFTSNEIVFFFFILDYLEKNNKPLSMAEIHNAFWEIHPDGFSRDAAHKWIKKKGCPSGVIKFDNGKYRLSERTDLSHFGDALSFFSEIAPVGVIGSFIIDKEDAFDSVFKYKQHYVGQAFDHEIICNLLVSIKDSLYVELHYLTRDKKEKNLIIAPICILSSTQNGRQFLIGWEETSQTYMNFRIDYIKGLTILGDIIENHASLKEEYNKLRDNIWGVSLGNGKLEHIDLLIKAEDNEPFIVRRLYREKRCGKVSSVGDGLFRFEADVYDVQEMFPWMRTFIGRIVSLQISDKEYENLFWDSFFKMSEAY